MQQQPQKVDRNTCARLALKQNLSVRFWDCDHTPPTNMATSTASSPTPARLFTRWLRDNGEEKATMEAVRSFFELIGEPLNKDTSAYAEDYVQRLGQSGLCTVTMLLLDCSTKLKDTRNARVVRLGDVTLNHDLAKLGLALIGVDEESLFGRLVKDLLGRESAHCTLAQLCEKYEEGLAEHMRMRESQSKAV
jgi:hypothetical protein